MPVTDIWLHQPCFVVTPGLPGPTSHALFAPPSDDTLPPDPVTDFQAETGDTRGAVRLRWRAPTDNVGVCAYEIRYSMDSLTESDWESCFPNDMDPLWGSCLPLGYDPHQHWEHVGTTVTIPKPAEPGTVQTLTVRMPRPETFYHFGIRSTDAAANLSAITFLETSTESGMVDEDGDGMRDGWESENGLDPERDDSQEDPDGDGLMNMRELGLGTHPKIRDTDRDGFSDGDELLVYGRGSGPILSTSGPPPRMATPNATPGSSWAATGCVRTGRAAPSWACFPAPAGPTPWSPGATGSGSTAPPS